MKAIGLFSTVFVILSYGCSENNAITSNLDYDFMPIENGTPQCIRIDSETEVNVGFDVTDAFDSVSFVKLSSEPEATITKIDQLIITDSIIVVQDRYGTGVKIFSSDGQYLCDVGNRGRGPGEYVEPTHMEIYKNRIVIWDQFSHKLIYYTLKGEYLYSREILHHSLKFHQFQDDRTLFNSVNSDNDSKFEDYTLFVCDTLSNVVSVGMCRKKNSYRSIWENHNFFCFDSTTYYHPTYSDTIYTIASNFSIQSRFYFDFGENTLPESLKKNVSNRTFIKAQKGGQYSFLGGDFFVTKDYLLFVYNKACRQYVGIYSKVSNKSVSFYLRGNKKIFPLEFGNIVTSTDDAFVGYCYPSARVQNTQFFPSQRDSLISLYGKERTDLIYSMKNDDNAIITFFYPSL